MYEQLTRDELSKKGIPAENLVEKPASLRPEKDSPDCTNYTVVVDFSGISLDRLREFAAQKLVISFANGNRKNFVKIKANVDRDKTIILIKADTIGLRTPASPEAMVSRLRSPEAVEKAVELAMEQYYKLLQAQGFNPEQIKAKAASLQRKSAAIR